jgi:hypothetical protein
MATVARVPLQGKHLFDAGVDIERAFVLTLVSNTRSKPWGLSPPASKEHRMAAIAFAPASVPRRHTPRPAVHRRRLVAFALLALIPFVLSWAARTTLGGGSLTAPGRSAPSRTYVVQSGDTLWNVARALHPRGDLRATVDRLATVHRGSELQAGERIALR